MTLKCFKCSAEVVFDSEHIGKNGKKIPLDPSTKQPHDCPMREKPLVTNKGVNFEEMGRRLNQIDEDKNDHGNEDVGVKLFDDPTKVKVEFLDHTAKGVSKVKIFWDANSEAVEREYNEFLANNKVKTQGAQFHISEEPENRTFAIALYYEEVAKQ